MVTAATDWDGPADRKRVRPALFGSYEALLHETAIPAFMLLIRDDHELMSVLRGPKLERAIGVIYRPQSERVSHYFRADMARQFDAVIHFDLARAVEPLEITAEWRAGELPETYPSTL